MKRKESITMIKKFLRSAGILALAGLLSGPLASTASAQVSSGGTASGDSYNTAEAFTLIQKILTLEKQKVSADLALKVAIERIARQDALLAEKDAEIKKLEAAAASSTGKAKIALEQKLRAARFDRIKLEAAHRGLATQLAQAKIQTSTLAKQLAAQKAALENLTGGACSVSNGSFSCVL